MADPVDPAALERDELAGLIVRHTFELNLYFRAASLAGLPIQADLVDRVNDAHPNGYPELHVMAGEVGWP